MSSMQTPMMTPLMSMSYILLVCFNYMGEGVSFKYNDNLPALTGPGQYDDEGSTPPPPAEAESKPESRLITSDNYKYAENYTRFYNFSMSIPLDVKLSNKSEEEEEYICTVKQLTLEQDVYLHELLYTFPLLRTHDDVIDGSGRSGGRRIHHVLLYGCTDVVTFALRNKYWDCNGPGKRSVCRNRKHIPLAPSGRKSSNKAGNKCGSTRATFPHPQIGFGIGPAFEINYLMLEVHFKGTPTWTGVNYDSVSNKTEITEDCQSVELVAYGKSQRPKYLSGMLVMAGVGFQIPPKTRAYPVDVNCKLEVPHPILLYAYWAHTHRFGSSVSGFKVNNDLNPHSTVRFVKQTPHLGQPMSVEINPKLSFATGDYVATRCTYDSENQTSTILWGPRQEENEMCNLFLFFYTKSSNPNHLSISCVNEKFKSVTKLVDSMLNSKSIDARAATQAPRSHDNDSNICKLYHLFQIKECPF